MISIIVPIYNVASFLPKCIDSILCQTYEDFELILVDDGSTDASGGICDKYALQDQRIVVEHCSNSGVAAARNTGTLKASGEYICYIDADDWVDKDYLLTMYNYAQKYNLDITQSGFYYAYDDFVLTVRVSKMIESYTRVEALKLLLQQKKIKNFPWGKLIRTKIAQKYLFPSIKNYEDSYWFYKILCESSSYTIINKPLYFYRQRIGSLTNKLDISSILLLRGSEERILFIHENYNILLPLAYKEYAKQLIVLYTASMKSSISIRRAFKTYKDEALVKYSSEFKFLRFKSPFLFLKIKLLKNDNMNLLWLCCKVEALFSRFFNSNIDFIKIKIDEIC